MAQHLTWRGSDGIRRNLELPGLHDRLTADDIRKKFLSLRGLQERQVYLMTVMMHYPLQVADSGLIDWFGDKRNFANTNEKLKWVHSVESYRNTAGDAFHKLSDKQQKILLMVFVDNLSIAETAIALGITRKHCNQLYRQAVLSVFPEYENNLRSVRKMREELAVLLQQETSWREQSGNEEDRLTSLSTRQRNGRREYSSWDEEDDNQPDEDWE